MKSWSTKLIGYILRKYYHISGWKVSHQHSRYSDNFLCIPNHIILNWENSFRSKLYVICRSFCNTPICKIGNAAHRYYFLYIVGMYVYHFLWNSSQCSAEYISIEEQQKKARGIYNWVRISTTNGQNVTTRYLCFRKDT